MPALRSSAAGILPARGPPRAAPAARPLAGRRCLAERPSKSAQGRMRREPLRSADFASGGCRNVPSAHGSRRVVAQRETAAIPALLLPLYLDSVTLQLPVEVRALDDEGLGRAGDIAAMAAQRSQDVAAFEVVAGFA